MGSKSFFYQNISLAVLAFGFFVYVAVDLKVFGFVWERFSSLQDSFQDKGSASASTTASLAELDLKLENQEKKIEAKEISLNRSLKELNQTQDRIRQEREELSQLRKEYLQMKERRMVLADSARRLPAQTTSERAPLNELLREVSQIENWNELAKQINEKDNSPVQVDTIQRDQRDLLRFSHQKPYSDDSIYLRRSGIRFGRLVAAGALKLGASEIQVLYPEEEGSTPGERTLEERALVMQNYLKGLLGNRIPVVRRRFDASLARSSDKVELGVDINPVRDEKE